MSGCGAESLSPSVSSIRVHDTKGEIVSNDYSGVAAGLGFGVLLVGIIVYVAILALAVWIGYLVMRTAVKNGILRADEERARRGYGGHGSTPPPEGYGPGPGA